jgi:TolA-binding protein
MASQAAKFVESAENALAKYGDGKGPAPIAEVHGSAAKPDKGKELSGVAKAYYDAVSLFSQEKYQPALLAFKKIVEEGQDPEYVAKSVYEIGRCLFLTGNHDGCIKHYTQMITAYPKHPDLGDALFFMAQSHEKKGDKDRAGTFYKKILSMTTDEDDMIHIKAKKALKALEA